MNCLTNTSYRMINKILRRLQSSSSMVSSTSSNVDIKIPDRIERGPTDILRALEKTISRDFSVPHYKYFNDPYLVPTSKQLQRHYALSFESGRKTAMWIHKEHGDLFRTDIADPPIEEFMPPIEYTKKDQVSEEILLKTISSGKTIEALHIYNLLEENVSIKAKQNLLELLCFSNSKDLLQFSFKEEKWYRFDDDRKKRNTWNQTAEIEKLFHFLTSQDAETAAAAYNALICGKAKYLNTQEVWPLYLQCLEKKIPLNINTYNAIIKIIPFVQGQSTDLINTTYKILEEMSTNGIRPNVGTLNSSLEIIYSLRSYYLAENFIYTLFKEFNSIGIRPSLASYCYILHLESKNSDSLISILEDMINVLEKDTLELHDPADTNFFPMAMEIVKMDSNLQLGEKLHNLLLKDNNFKFISNAYAENIYYRHYVSLKLAVLPIEKFFEFYYQLSKHIYIPENSIIENIMETLKLQSNEIIIEHLPKLWSQIYMYNMLTSKTIKIALKLTCQCNVEQDSPLRETFASYAWDFWQLNQKLKSDIRKFIWDVNILSDILFLLLHANWENEAYEIISFMISNEELITDKLDATQINELLEICIFHSYGSIALLLIEWSMKSGLKEVGSMARKVNDVISLTTAEKKKLIDLVGNDILELKLSD